MTYNNLENDDLSLRFCSIKLIFGRLTCFDMKSIISLIVFVDLRFVFQK